MGSMGAIAFFMNSGGAKTIPAGVTVAWPSTNASIPSGWSRETSADARFVKMVPTALTNPGATGGSDAHSHAVPSHQHAWNAHSHSGGTSGTTSDYYDSYGTTGSSDSLDTHTHAYALDGASMTAAAAASDTSTTAGLPAYFAVVFVKSDGTPTQYPAGAVAWYNGAAPAGWTTHTASDGRAFRGAAAGGDGGGTGGSNSHTHTTPHTHAASGGSHSHGVSLSASGSVRSVQSSPDTLMAPPSHTHTGTSGSTADPALAASGDASGSTDGRPAFRVLRAIQASADATPPVGIIALWFGTLASMPAGWSICDGLNSTPDLLDRFIWATNPGLVGDTGGGAHAHTHSHAHAASTSHTHTGGTSGQTGAAGIDTGDIRPYVALKTHTHTFGASGSTTPSAQSTDPGLSNATHAPSYVEGVYMQFV